MQTDVERRPSLIIAGEQCEERMEFLEGLFMEDSDVTDLGYYGNADAVMVLKGGIRLLVSSEILIYSSQVFAALFRPEFREGSEIIQGKCPDIDLPEDDPVSMSLILMILHDYMSHDIASRIPNPKQLVFIALLCDKYDCSYRMSPWIELWLREHLKVFSGPDWNGAGSYDIGPLLLAAHYFRHESSFKSLTQRAHQCLTKWFSNSWGSIEMDYMGMAFLVPRRLERDLKNGIKAVQKAVQEEIITAVEQVRQIETVFTTKQCATCDTPYVKDQDQSANIISMKKEPTQTKIYNHCTVDHRIALLNDILARVHLCPPFGEDYPFTICGVINSLNEAVDFASTHICIGGSACPLKAELESLKQKVDSIRNNITGFELYSLNLGETVSNYSQTSEEDEKDEEKKKRKDKNSRKNKSKQKKKRKIR